VMMEYRLLIRGSAWKEDCHVIDPSSDA
jgi:hypothetical protein